MTYSAAHLFQMVTAFELINLGFPAAQATKLTEERWTEFAAGYALVDDFWKRRKKPSKNKIFARIMHKSMYDIQVIDVRGSEVPSRVFIEDIESLKYILEANVYRSAHTYAVMCITDIYRGIMSVATHGSGVGDTFADDELTTWLVEFSEENWWLMAQGGWRIMHGVKADADGNPQT